MQEAEKRSDETESGSMKETKGRAPDLRPDEKIRKEKKKTELIRISQENLQEERREGASKRVGSIPSSDENRENMNLRDAYPVRPGEKDCQFYLDTGLCGYGRSCRYNHPTHLLKDHPERSDLPICKHFRRGNCRFGSVCVYRHLEDMEGSDVYQPRRTHEIESGSRPEKRAKIILDSEERGSKERFENLEELREQDNPQEQIQRYTERQVTERAHHNLHQQSNDESEAQDNMQVHQPEQEQEMKTPHHTPQQQQPVQTPQQQPSLASHFNLYPSVEKLADAIEAGPRDQNSGALVTEVNSHFDKCQQLLNSISKSLGSHINVYVDDHKEKLEENEQLLQQRKALIEEYKKSVEEIMKKEP
ncbi:putative zinc finger CCCH domain-containing protein 9 [Capsella rubella]|uniref:putative zinc finger CCCH domain-containing protein 9 n=1 Tax=Capsella rubella TaxID=81985 RepID=UPI000CD4D82A|nr:putative zinc finger CCCH domain-containing protein 9 [Capsella rubella]